MFGNPKPPRVDLRGSKIRTWTKTRDASAPERPLLLLGIAPEFVSCIKSMLIGCSVACLDSWAMRDAFARKFGILRTECDANFTLDGRSDGK
jgi:hypothetical protein